MKNILDSKEVWKMMRPLEIWYIWNGTFGNFPTKLLKEVSDICAPALNDIWNNEIITQKYFPNNVKVVNVTSVFKKEDASLLRTIDQWVFYRSHLKSIKELRRTRFMYGQIDI